MSVPDYFGSIVVFQSDQLFELGVFRTSTTGADAGLNHQQE